MLKETKKKDVFNKYPIEEAYEEFSLDKYLRGGEKIEDYREFWEQQVKKLRVYHESSESGEGFLHMHGELMNVLLRHLYNNTKIIYAKKYEKEWSYPASLVGIGGYGRNALAPYSDVDLVLLHSEKIHSDILDPFVEIFHQEVILPLWDLKIKVSIAIRTINNTIEEAKKNFNIKNAQLDARLICGSKNLFNTFQETYDAYFRSEPIEAFINHIIREKSSRHKRQNDTIFLLEPDIKLGVGGLRDYKTILWLARAKLKVATLRAIEDQGFLSSSEVEKLTEAHNFLIRVRNELQFQSNYASNILNIAKQSSVALALDYKIVDHFARVEIFMKDYYRHAKCIHEIVGLFEERLTKNKECHKKSWLELIIKNRVKNKDIQKPKKEIDGFIIADNILTYQSKDVFKENPVRLVRAFKHAQQYHAELSRELKILIKNSLDLITEKVVNDQASNRCLCAILQTVGEVSSILKLMHELGILGRFIPEIESITHLAKHEYYHQYTVDTHTLNAIQVLDEIFESKDFESKHYYNAIKNTTSPWLSYLILLLHDLGKAQRTGDAIEHSVKLAKKILDRLQIGPIQQEYVLFAIKNQFQMIQFCQKCDIDDPQVVAAFSSFIGDKEILNYLYVTAYCDAKGTATNFWNSHKEILHTKLFENTLEFFIKNEGSIEEQIDQRKNKYRQSIHKRNPEMSYSEITQMLELYPHDYFILNNPQEIELHIHLLEQFKKDLEKQGCRNSMPIVHWENDIDQCVTVVTIIGWDRTRLLANLAGTFAISGFDILNTKVFTRGDKIIIDTFYVIEGKDNFSPIEDLKQRFQKNLNSILIDNVNPTAEILAQRKTSFKHLLIENDLREKLASINPCVNVHHEHIINRTILEIQCEDQIGLLHRIASVISERGFNITFARISTEHKIAIDTLHISKINSNEITTTQDLITLREQLNEALQLRD